jgi:hypothetical protein
VATFQLVFRHPANVNELEVGCSALQLCEKASGLVARLDSTSLETLVEQLLQPSSRFPLAPAASAGLCVQALCKLPAAAQLSSEAVVRLMQTALAHNDEASVCVLSQLPAATVAGGVN